MNAIAIPPLLLENEVLRQCLRDRDARGLAPEAGLVVPQVMKPEGRQRLQAALAGLPMGPGPDPAAWPDALQQLHAELSASTTLRPLAHLMGKGALLPDPWNGQGGLHGAAADLPAGLQQHSQTRLYTVLRADLVLQGSGEVATEAQNWALEAGDLLLLLAEQPVSCRWSDTAQVWTVYYYAPDPCCCRTRPSAGGAAA